jgi:hypothetical protein
MTEVPKVVYDRLRAALPERTPAGLDAPEQAHPDANLLAGFAEQALSATERSNILKHLSLCAGCRDVVTLALPPASVGADTAPAGIETEAGQATLIPTADTKAGRGWLKSANLGWMQLPWPSLRWAALAAGVAVAATVLLVHPGKLNQAVLPSLARPNTVRPDTVRPGASATQPTSESQIALSPAPSSGANAVPAPTSTVGQPARSLKTEEARPTSELQLTKRLNRERSANPPHPVEAGQSFSTANNFAPDDNKVLSRAGNVSTASSTGGIAAGHAGQSTVQQTPETIEVAGAQVTASPAPSGNGALMARNDAPAIEKAKPALPDSATKDSITQESATPNSAANDLRTTQTEVNPVHPASRTAARMSARKSTSPAEQTLAQNTLTAQNMSPQRNPTWEITGGTLQKSFDSGQNWENALHAAHPLLCYASHDENVWTGGQGGILFHSVDGGITWIQIQPSIKTQQLSSDITRIDIPSRSDIILTTSSNEVWSSADSGKTWNKK